MGRTVVVSACRTPFGKFGGALKEWRAVDLGGLVIRETLARAGVLGSEVDEVIMGMVVQAGAGQNPSRQASRIAGLPWDIHSETVNKVCASGLRAVTLADQIIRAGDAGTIVAGGMESMSHIPYGLPSARWGSRMGHGAIQDLLLQDGLMCAFDHVHMAEHGNRVAAEYKITREEQDAWALRSHRLAVAASDEGKLADELVSVPIYDRKGRAGLIELDEGPRRDTSLERLAALPSVFASDGTITAGNAPGVSDGAGALLLMSEEHAKSLGKKPLATIVGHASVGQEARYIATAPALAIHKLLKKTGYDIQAIDLFEVNEAFASVILTSARLVGWDPDKVNVNGGAIAFGHPIGASGARILMTLIYELRRRGGGLGVAAICSGGAQGDAVLMEVHAPEGT
ncbi:acetyl-CoA C-acetyltransferase [Cohnella yongneupensis]|uniref:acetyl-CoA C-acetyltransferase n=1 Tax=Cohnella yongneupensis TaxID=425006 RepID=A0ABW0R2E8_9BACL